MYVTSEALRLMDKSHNPAFDHDESAVLASYKSKLDKTTRFIPVWVKWPWPWLWGWAPWSAGNASSSPSEKKSAKTA